MRSSSLREHAFKLSTATVYIFLDSVLCLGGKNCRKSTVCTVLDEQKEWFTQSPTCRELDNISGEPVVFEWKIFPGHTMMTLLQEVQNMIEKDNIKLEDRIIFISMYNDIDWVRKGNEESCKRNSSSVAKYAQKIPKGHWSFLGIRRKMVCFARPQTRRFVEQSR